MERKGLGRGLSALIPEKEHYHHEGRTHEMREKILYLSISEIRPNPYQPRENFDTESLEDLTASIKEKGIIQPILVRPSAGGFELIAGERRLRAAKALHLNEIPAIIKEVKDEESLELALIENIQRQNLSPIEEAYAYKHLIDQFNFTQEKIAQAVGKARVSVTNTLRLLKLPQEIQDMLKAAIISFAHGKVLLEIEDTQKQLTFAKKILSDGWSVKELAAAILPQEKTKRQKAKENTSEHLHLKAMAEELQEILGSKVKIVPGRKCGTVQIEFYSQDDLERIYKTIKR